MTTSGIRYEVRYVEPNAKWEPADPIKVRRILAEYGDPVAQLSNMVQGYEMRTKFADYRIRAACLGKEAQALQAAEDSRFQKQSA